MVSKIPEGVYVKRITPREHKFIQYILEKDSDIIPKVISLDPNKVIYEKYPHTLADYYNDSKDITKFEKAINNIIDRLHKINIIRSDLHEQNIVIKDDEVRLIDFGQSFFFDEFNSVVLTFLNKFLEPPVPFENMDDILKYEHIMYKI